MRSEAAGPSHEPLSLTEKLREAPHFQLPPEAAAAALKNVAEGLVLARGSCYGVLDKINQG